MTLIERLLAQANKESNELADLLNEAVEALLQAGEELNQMTDTMIEAVEEMNQPKQEPLGTYESITDIMLQLRNGTTADQQIYEVMKDKPLYAQVQAAQDQKPVAVVLQRNVKVGSTGGFRMKRYISPINNGKLEMSPDLNAGDYLFKSAAIQSKLKEKNT